MKQFPTIRRGIKPLLPPLFLLIFLFSISPAYAEGEVDIASIPTYLAEKLGIPLFAGQLLASTILLFIFLLPIALISRRKGHGWLAELIVGLAVMGVCIALGWLPYFFLILTILIIALLYAGKAKGWVGG